MVGRGVREWTGRGQGVDRGRAGAGWGRFPVPSPPADTDPSAAVTAPDCFSSALLPCLLRRPAEISRFQRFHGVLRNRFATARDETVVGGRSETDNNYNNAILWLNMGVI